MFHVKHYTDLPFYKKQEIKKTNICNYFPGNNFYKKIVIDDFIHQPLFQNFRYLDHQDFQYFHQ